MSSLFVRLEGEVLQGKDITIPDQMPRILISESDEVFCYTGICVYDPKHPVGSIFAQPFYMHGCHSADLEISDSIIGFYRVIDGCVILDDYVDSGYKRQRLYKSIGCDAWLSFQCRNYSETANKYKAKTLERKIFGLEHSELANLLTAYAKLMGTYNGFNPYPSLRTAKRSHYCDLTDAWIPEEFPYIAFNDNGYRFSHISLYGFYRHIQLLTNFQTESVFCNELLKYGASKSAITRITSMNNYDLYGEKIIKKGMLPIR